MPRPPKFQQAREAIEARLRQGRYRPGDQLPSETDLAREFNLSRNCIRKALESMKESGVLVSHRGQGCFVAETGPNLTPPSAGRGASSSGDLALVIGVNFRDWSPTITACTLYSMLEQEVHLRGKRFHHVQVDGVDCSDTLLRNVEATGAPLVVVAAQVVEQQSDPAYFMERLRRLGRRVVTVSFEMALAYADSDVIFTDWGPGLFDALTDLTARHSGRIAFAGYDTISWSDRRRGYFLAGLQTLGRWAPGEPLPISPYPEPITMLRNGRPQGPIEAIASRALLAWLQDHPTDALICVNDRLFETLLQMAPRESLPELVGFDNSLFAASQGLSSIGIMMRHHVEAILNRLYSPQSGPQPGVATTVAIPTQYLRRSH